MEAHRARRSVNAFIHKAVGMKDAPTAVAIDHINNKIQKAKEYLTRALGKDTEYMVAVNTDGIADAVMSRKDPKEHMYDELLERLNDAEETETECFDVAMRLARMYVERSRLIRDLMKETEKNTVTWEQAKANDPDAFLDDDEEEEEDGKAEGKMKTEDKLDEDDEDDSHEEQRAEYLWHDSDCHMMGYLQSDGQEKLAEVLEDTTF